MSDLIDRVRAAQVKTAEDVVIAGIPADITETMRKTDKSFKARGGCKGCGSMVLAVHHGSCPTLREPDFY